MHKKRIEAVCLQYKLKSNANESMQQVKTEAQEIPFKNKEAFLV